MLCQIIFVTERGQLSSIHATVQQVHKTMLSVLLSMDSDCSTEMHLI